LLGPTPHSWGHSSISTKVGPSCTSADPHFRRRTFKGGKLIFNKGLSVLDCVIRNLSDRGARVELGTAIGVPDTFELIIAPDRVKRSCKIAWRSKRHIGISFT
jgi:hypothetical protein